MSEASADKIVRPGWWVKIAGFEPHQPDEAETYWIVDGPDADLFANQIPGESLLAKALVGTAVGEVVCYHPPTGEFQLKIVDAGPS